MKLKPYTVVLQIMNAWNTNPFKNIVFWYSFIDLIVKRVRLPSASRLDNCIKENSLMHIEKWRLDNLVGVSLVGYDVAK